MSTPRALVTAARPLLRRPFMGTATTQTRFAALRSGGSFSTGRSQAGLRPNVAAGHGQQKGWQGGKRWSSAAAGEQQAGWFKRMWDSPIGLKTVHFWAPVMKVRPSPPLSSRHVVSAGLVRRFAGSVPG
jgi:hypothetical protein